ncbi:MAG: winged helix DNA-binding domain-containing protein [Pseudonocardiaceae bacterium]
MTTLHDIALLRLAAQRVAGPGFATAADAVRWLTAVQAQDYPGAVTSIALRTESRTRQSVEAALNTGDVVRSWPMRGTLHFVLAEDLPWMLDLTTTRLIAGAASRRTQLGLDLPTIERARQVAMDALAGGRQLRRNALLAFWDEAGLLTVKQRSYHFIWHLAQTGTLCYGPVRDVEQQLVLLDEWVTRPRHPEREEALAEWALRYFHSHGPATVKDFAWWTKLTAADVKTGLAIARHQLERLDVDGVEYFMHPETMALLDSCRNRAQGVFLSPASTNTCWATRIAARRCPLSSPSASSQETMACSSRPSLPTARSSAPESEPVAALHRPCTPHRSHHFRARFTRRFHSATAPFRDQRAGATASMLAMVKSRWELRRWHQESSHLP